MPLVDWDEIKIKFIPEIKQFEPIVLPNKDGQELTRKVVKATVIDPNPRNPNAPLEIRICHQRKNREGKFEDCENYNLAQLSAGKEIQMILDTEQTLALSEILSKLYIKCKDELGLNVNQIFTLEKIDEIVKVPANRKEFIEGLVKDNYEEEFWRELERLKPYTANKFAYARVYENRNNSLTEFKKHLDNNDWNELEWQDFFEKNTWIFGYGLNYKILKNIQSQPNYGGTTVDGTGGQKGDYLVASEANTKFTVLVEIKKPQTSVLGTNQYRNGSWALGNELTGGVSQLQTSCRIWDIEGSRTDSNREITNNLQVNTIEPKGILVVGNTNQLTTHQKRTSFELFRRNIHNPEILTFDELFQRAKFIVEHTNVKLMR